MFKSTDFSNCLLVPPVEFPGGPVGFPGRILPGSFPVVYHAGYSHFVRYGNHHDYYYDYYYYYDNNRDYNFGRDCSLDHGYNYFGSVWNYNSLC